MADLPSDSAIAEALSAAGSAHHEYEQTALERHPRRAVGRPRRRRPHGNVVEL